MVPNDIWLRTEWLSCRRTSVLRCVERYCAAAAREYRRALRRMQEVEEKMAQVEPETGRRLPSQPAQAELLNRRLAAANAEIRRYQTRLYACEHCGRRTLSWKLCVSRRGQTACCRPCPRSPRCWNSPVCR